MKLTKIRTVAALSLAIALIGGATVAMPANAAETARHITVTATGSTSVTPDAVRINAMVSVLEKTSRGALATAGTISTALRKALTANKIAAADVATQFISVAPEYTYAQDGSTPPLLVGYRASQSFVITVRAATTAGAVVDAIVNAGGDNVVVNAVSPFVMNSDKATASARDAAVKIARTKATAYAKAVGVKLGRIVYLTEDSSPTVFPVYGAMAKAEDSATQVDLGTQRVSVSITVRYSL
jgi:uncharacterized protein YggE